MRHEVLLLLSMEGDSIHDKWNAVDEKEIKITENVVFWGDLYNKMLPIFPELEENLCVDQIYLKNLNKDPTFDDEVSLFSIQNSFF